MVPAQLQQLLDKYSQGICTPAEEQLINDWYQRIGEKETPLLQPHEKGLIEERLWSAINPVPAQRMRKGLRIAARAAAISLPILAALGLYFNRESVTDLVSPVRAEKPVARELREVFRNDGKTQMQVTLADGSIVHLKPQSEIIISKDFGKTARRVQLKGEGFFTVVRDTERPFVVYTREVVARVLGTSFNVRAYDDDREITVAVKTGKVSVSAGKHKPCNQETQSPEVILTPNQQIVYNRREEVISKQLVKDPEIVLPNSDLFRMQFENIEVTEILDVLQKNYGVEIRYDTDVLSNCRLTTSMSDEGLYERIAVICKAIGASYVIHDAVISIKSNGC